MAVLVIYVAVMAVFAYDWIFRGDLTARAFFLTQAGLITGAVSGILVMVQRTTADPPPPP